MCRPSCRDSLVLQVLPSDVTAAEPVLAELSRWEQNYVDVTALRKRAERAERDNETLGEKVTLLEKRVQVSRPDRTTDLSCSLQLVTKLMHYSLA